MGDLAIRDLAQTRRYVKVGGEPATSSSSAVSPRQRVSSEIEKFEAKPYKIKGAEALPEKIKYIAEVGIPNAVKMKSYQTAATLCLTVAKYDKSYYEKSYEYTVMLEETYPEMAEEMYNRILRQMEERFDFVDMAEVYINIRAKLLKGIGGR